MVTRPFELLVQVFWTIFLSNIKYPNDLAKNIISFVSFSDLKQNEFGKDKFNKAISIDPNNSKAFNNLCISYMQEKNYLKAKQIIFQ